MKILYVENDELQGQSNLRFMQENGHEVHWAKSPDEALRYLNEGNECDIVCTDMRLLNDIDPRDKSGIDLTEKIKSLRSELPVVLFSGSPPRSGDPDCIRFEMAGGSRMVNKVTGVYKLLEVLEEVLHSPGQLR